MAVVTDSLLSALTNRTPTRAADSQRSLGDTRDDSESFASVYAREQPPEPVARTAEPARPREAASAARSDTDNRQGKVERKQDRAEAKDAGADKPAADDGAAAASGKTTVAGGKSLPEQDEDASADSDAQAQADAPLDPLLLLGISGQLPAEPAPTLATATLGGDGSATTADASMLGQVMPTLDLTAALGQSATAEGEGDAPSASLPSLTLPLGDPAAKADAKAGSDANALAAATATATSSGGDVSADSLLQAMGVPGETPKASQEGGRSADNFADRLTALTQAVSAAPNQTARPVMPTAPGQGMTLQQDLPDQVVDRVMWMSSQNLKSAEIQMSPEHLGRLEVRIDIGQDQTQVNFSSANAAVRDALTAQQQQLRDMLSQQGMTQVNVNVSDQAQQGWQQQGQAHGTGKGRGGRGDAGEEETVLGVSELPTRAGRAPLGLVDYYA